MSDYSWLRQKSPEHLARIQARAVGNQNAKKHGLYSRTPPAMTCNQCPNAKTCPYFKPGKVCFWVLDKLNEMAERAKQLLGGRL